MRSIDSAARAVQRSISISRSDVVRAIVLAIARAVQRSISISRSDVVRSTIVLAILLSSTPSRADLLNHDLLREHVDQLFAEHRDVEEAPRASLVLPTLIPGIGTYRVEKRVFGGLRPAGVVFDWGLGGAVPVTFGAIALGSSGRTREVCAWTAIGAYAVTRLAILVIANLHISEYNRRVRKNRASIAP